MDKSQLRVLAKEWGCSVAEAQQRVREAEQATRTDSFKRAFHSLEGRYVFAIRHLKDGQEEVMAIKANFEKLPRPRNDSETLLHAICLQDWAERFDEVGYQILEYVVQMKTYKTLCEIDSDQKMGMIVNFYESDPDRLETHSCRQAILTLNEGVQKAVEEWYREHGNEDYAINSHLWKYGLRQ